MNLKLKKKEETRAITDHRSPGKGSFFLTELIMHQI